ncbi:hypothetical protein WOLCODRAFT_80891 [Wolfiporia cocos MD-104 SS10]|uniref:DUF6533 domain-containing protein n=1 Tax=Wolfiporia cocos (strain MD-104) TaxID=742152 RepID=A0A2H3J147_WOLCO|nr:hypothetical protein WOLCODRAFT_80891 [Wolfiporia cocos MD-104 SS10]
MISVFVFYEHLITLDEEARLIWSGPLTGPKLLFMLVRYIVLAICILQIFSIAPQYSAVVCPFNSINILSMILDLSQYIVVNGFAILRIYAITGRRWIPIALSSVLLSVAVALNMYAYCRSTYPIIVDFGVAVSCQWTFRISKNYASLLPNIIIDRFLINLRHADAKASSESTEETSVDPSGQTYREADSIRFSSRVVGNMGESIEDGFTTSLDSDGGQEIGSSEDYGRNLSSGPDQECIELERLRSKDA